MESQILETLKGYAVGNDVLKSETFEMVRTRLSYFEEFIKGEAVPDFAGMINQFIKNDIGDSPARLDVQYRDRYLQHLALRCEERELSVQVGTSLAIPLEVKVNYQDDPNGHRSRTFHITKFGYNRSDWQKLALKGVEINGYNIPDDVANVVLKDFEKVQGKDRNDIILKLASSEEVVECYPKNYWVENSKKEIRERGTTVIGIDEKKVWTLNRPGAQVSVYGNANGYVGDRNKISLSARVERTGKKFSFPGYS